MRRKVVRWVLALTLLMTWGLLGGCADEDGDGGSTSDLPPQEGLEVGDDAPDFRLKNQDQETIVLKEQLAQGNVVVVFYPMAFTPV